MSIMKGKLFLLIGPSGVGKGTAISQLKKRHPDWVFPISATTRSKRPQEKEGQTYYFLSTAEFELKKRQDEFLEWAVVHGQKQYGLLKKPVISALKKGKVVFREIDIQGYQQVRENLAKENLVAIFLLPPSLQILQKRIVARSPLSSEEVERRMASAKEELLSAPQCDFQITTIDGDFDNTTEAIEEIVASAMSEGD
jgi:guanylate kinase